MALGKSQNRSDYKNDGEYNLHVRNKVTKILEQNGTIIQGVSQDIKMVPTFLGNVHFQDVGSYDWCKTSGCEDSNCKYLSEWIFSHSKCIVVPHDPSISVQCPFLGTLEVRLADVLLRRNDGATEFPCIQVIEIRLM